MMVKRNSSGAKNMLCICDGRKTVRTARCCYCCFVVRAAFQLLRISIITASSSSSSLSAAAALTFLYLYWLPSLSSLSTFATVSYCSPKVSRARLCVYVCVYANDCSSWNVNYMVYIRDIRSTRCGIDAIFSLFHLFLRMAVIFVTNKTSVKDDFFPFVLCVCYNCRRRRCRCYTSTITMAFIQTVVDAYTHTQWLNGLKHLVKFMLKWDVHLVELHVFDGIALANVDHITFLFIPFLCDIATYKLLQTSQKQLMMHCFDRNQISALRFDFRFQIISASWCVRRVCVCRCNARADIT